MLNSTEHEISLGHKNKNTKNLKLFFMLNSAEHAQLSWAWKKFWKIVSIYKIYKQNKFHAQLSEHEKSFITSGPDATECNIS